ncbi:hypothetical protein EMIHUDRAFT_227917 [Emiliania huxleyi CCMP1516]|uniref:Uncharacterized protein n=2 Tax=Emiliania huxleyi TaxID=2903 RepID=A0A0D3KGN5_EMIH1|nr:hypothetical protein EMIHUDRAFT_227917 [Emiliania huxleyi CCMP1516]EOD34920.1 hypothetical protein EMIHUDRAFT_227917 [Emiliania huxleyi CCMP1516]|eukprot:XP_005787349.1 hypothetical protein EMIHUDRAFT_227917 [Emiliania huxleyi CCMP1516]
MPNEERPAFEERCKAEVEEKIDKESEIAKLRSSYETKSDRLQETIPPREAARRGCKMAGGAQKGAWFGDAIDIGSSSAAGKIKKQKDNLQKLRDEAEARGEGGAGRTREGQELKEELEDKIAKIRTEEGWGSGSRSSIAYREEQDLEATEEAEIGLEKNDIKVNKFEILWIPVTRRIAVQVPSI